MADQAKDLVAQSAVTHATTTSKGIPVRFLLSTGEKVGMGCRAEETFGDIKDKIWSRKNLPQKLKAGFVFKIAKGEVFFKDEDRFARLLELSSVFRESTEERILMVALVEAADIGDALQRKKKRPNEMEPLMHSVLFKKGPKKGAKWRKRYFVLSSMTLFYFDSVKAFASGAAAMKFVEMGSCQALPIEETYRGRPFCFELKADHLPNRRNFILCAESQEILERWLRVIYSVNVRRVKSISVTVIEELERRGLAGLNGVFRVPGSQDKMFEIKHRFDCGDYPDLSTYKEWESVAGVLKLSLRELSEPILTFALYQGFKSLASLRGAELVEAATDLVAALPVASRGFLAYLLRFLSRVAKESDTNMMTAKNLAIVFGPNLLKPRVETLMTATQDTGLILTAVQNLIENYEEIWSIGKYVPPPPRSPAASPKKRTQLSRSQPASRALPTSPRGGASPFSFGGGSMGGFHGSMLEELKQQQLRRTNSPRQSPRRVAQSPKGVKKKPPPLAAKPRHVEAPQEREVSEDNLGLCLQLRALMKGYQDTQGQWSFRIRGSLAAVEKQWASLGTALESGGLMTELVSRKAVVEDVDRLVGQFSSLSEEVASSLDLLNKHLQRLTHHVRTSVAHRSTVPAEPTKPLPTLPKKATAVHCRSQSAAAKARFFEEAARKHSAGVASRAARESIPPPPPERTRERQPSSLPPPPPDSEIFVAMFSYSGGHRDDEVTFEEGEHVHVLDRSDTEGWWQGIARGKTGWFPGQYVGKPQD